MNITTEKQRQEQKKLLEALAGFELLKNITRKGDRDPMVAIGQMIMNRTEASYTDEELGDAIALMGKIYSEYNCIINSNDENLKTKKNKHDVRMRDRYLDEYEDISRMGLFPWDAGFMPMYG